MASGSTAISGLQAGYGIMSSYQGMKFAKETFKIQEQSEKAAANYNKALVEIQLNRDSAELGRRISRVVSTQRAQAAATGLQVGSKSFLMLMNEGLTQGEREAVQLRSSAQIKQSQIDYQRDKNIFEMELASKGQVRAQRGQMISSGVSLLGTAASSFGSGKSSKPTSSGSHSATGGSSFHGNTPQRSRML